MSDNGLLVTATVGAVVTAVSALVIHQISSTAAILRPTVFLTPVLGGGVAGHLQQGNVTVSVQVGVVTGLLAASLFVLSVVPMFLFTLLYSPMSSHETLIVIVKVAVFLSYVVGASTAGSVLARNLRKWSIRETSMS